MDQRQRSFTRPVLQPNDAESILASALLDIRSDSRRQNTVDTGVVERHTGAQQQQQQQQQLQQQQQQQQQQHLATPNRLKSPSTTVLVQRSPVAPNIRPIQALPSSTAIPSLSQYLQSERVFSSNPGAALQAAASAASLAAAASCLTNNPLSQLALIHQASLVGAALPSFCHPASPPVTSQPPQLLPGTQMDGSSETGRSHSNNIRMEQVEAALKSKPQRGRKREELSELERVELTRTRNREHAKTTRVRKKARYEELLTIEKLFEDLQQKSTMEMQRRQVVVQFLKSREHKLREFQPSDSSDSSGERTTAANNRSLTPSWRELVVNPSLFQFDDGRQKDDNPLLSSAQRMKRFDQYIYSKVTAEFGSSMVPMVRYRIGGEENGIALDSQNGGFAEFEISLSLPSTTLQLLTGIVRFRFGDDSEKLESWSHVHDLDLLVPSERLDAQISYPSTVSLDQPLGRSDDCGGPGMNI